MSRRARASGRAGFGAGLALACVTALAPARAQTENPVYLDDSPAARDTMAGLGGVIERGNLTEGVRVLQRLLDTEDQRVLESADDPDLFFSLRTTVHQRLLSDEALLARYREIEGPAAAAALERGEASEVERTRLLTPAGFDAAIEVARTQFRRGVFEAARLTLESLERHPDCVGARARTAASEAALVASYLDRPEVWAWAERWAASAGAAPVERVARAWPERLTRTGVDPGSPSGALRAEGLVGTPLQSVALGLAGDNPIAEVEARARERLMARSGRTSATFEPWVFPFVMGDRVYTNDGFTVAAWDRFTLAPRWRRAFRSPAIASGMELERLLGRTTNATPRGGMQLEDTNAFAWAWPYLITTTGLAHAGGRDGDGRLHAIDPDTGEVAWSVAVAGEIDPRLDFATIRGPAVSDGSTVVVAVRQQVANRRTSGSAMVGLDLADGSLRWVRMLGSVGALPHRTRTLVGARSSLREGVVYRADELGVIAAIEADTGRIRWLRRTDGPPSRRTTQESPWSGGVSVFDGDGGVIVHDASGSRLLRLDERDGRILGERTSAPFGDIDYLVRAGDHLVTVGRSTAAAAPIDRFETATIRPAAMATGTGFTGRAVVAGGRVLLPTTEGVRVFDPEEPDRVERLTLEETGHIVPMESQLLVADAEALHSYLVWEVAAELLRERIEASPRDPQPAQTFAELAYRAGRVTEIVPAIDLALGALDRASPGEEARAARGALFGSVRQMVLAAQHGGPEAGPGARGLAARPELIGALIDRLGLASASPAERVVYLMARGEHDERAGRPDAAARGYQSVLDDPALAVATWAGPDLLVRGGFEARRRLRRLVEDHGPRLYAIYDAEARAALPALVARADADALAALAQRYPAGGASSEVWLRAAEARAGEGAIRQRIDDLRAGLASAERFREAGGSIDASIEGELLGRLLTDLARLGEVERAAEALAEARARTPDLTPTMEGAPLSPEALALAASIAGPAPIARAVVGREVDRAGVRAIPGWVPVAPLLGGDEAQWPDRVLMRSLGGEWLALWRAPAGGAPLEPVWQMPMEGRRVELIRWTDDAAWLLTRSGPPDRAAAGGGARAAAFAVDEEGWSAERINLATGERVWRTGPFESAFEGLPAEALIDASGGAARVASPLDGSLPLGDLLVTADARTLALVERSGRTVAMDLVTGRTLWAWRGPVRRVYDAVLHDGRLALGGLTLPRVGANGEPIDPPGASGPGTPGSVLAVYDARTGESALEARPMERDIRWLRAGPGALYVGLDDRVIAIDPASGREHWANPDPRVESAQQAWLIGDRLYLADARRALVWLDTDSGRLSPEGVDPRGRLSPIGSVRVLAAPGNEPGALASSGTGVITIDADGRARGYDAIDADGGLLPVFAGRTRAGRGLVATADREGVPGEDNAIAFGFYLLDAASAELLAVERITLPAEPLGVRLLDGRALLETRLGCVELPLPVEPDEGARPAPVGAEDPIEGGAPALTGAEAEEG